MTAQIRVLGEVEVLVDGKRLDVGHSRQRCVLAALLVDVNHPVPVDQLIDRVWADQPPARARNALAGYVSRLRMVLAAVPGVGITRGPAGYTLTADAVAVDMHSFRHLAASARMEHDPGLAATLFEQALHLWHGEPFTGIDTPWIWSLRTSLDAERLSVELDRNDAALNAGHHTELLPVVESALHAYPLDERLAGQVMLAQFRCGRQADALETYRRMRERLVEELGVEPGPALRAVHRQILDSEAEPITPARSARPTVAVSSCLPRRPTTFIGRAAEVAAVAAAVCESPLVTLTGVGGVGKTRLALEAAERSLDRFEDGASLCELAPLADGSALADTVASAFGLQEKSGLGLEHTVIDYLRDRKLLLLLDNCEHLLDAAASFAVQVTRHCPGVVVLATSREPLAVAGERVLQVPPLSDDEATDLFAHRARAGRPDFDLDAEPVGAVAEICRRLDGVPLAIELAAARVRMMSSLDIARRLDRLRLLSGNARATHPRHQSVAATIDWSYRLLPEPEQALFDRLSVFAGSFDIDAAHGVCADEDATEDDTLELLTGLVDKSMVVVRGGAPITRYSVLEMLRAYGRQRLRDRGFRDDVERRHAQYFVDLVERGAAAMHGPEESAWIQRLAPTAGTTVSSPDTDNLRTAFERVMADGDADSAMRMVASVGELMQVRVGYASTAWVDRIDDIADPEHPLFAAALGVAARAAWVRGYFARAKELAALAGDRVPSPGHTYLGYPADVLADVALSEGDAATALAHYQSQVDVARATGDASRLVWVLYQITIDFDALGTAEAGLVAAQEAMRVAQTTRNPSTMAMACCAMGRPLKNSDPERAQRFFDQAVEHAAPVQNNWLTGIARMEAAATLAVHSDPGSAAKQFLEILDHWAKAGPGAGAQHWFTLRHVARLLGRLGADDDAAALNRAIVAAGHELLAGDSVTDAPCDSGALTGPQALALAHESLTRYC